MALFNEKCGAENINHKNVGVAHHSNHLIMSKLKSTDRKTI